MTLSIFFIKNYSDKFYNLSIKKQTIKYKSASIKEEYPEIHIEEKMIFDQIKKAIIDIVIIGIGGIQREKWISIFQKLLYYFDPDEKESEIIKRIQNLLFVLKFGTAMNIATTIVMLWRYFYTPSDIFEEPDDYSGPINDMLKGTNLINIPGKSNKEKAIITLAKANQTNVHKFKLKPEENKKFDIIDLSKHDLDELVQQDPEQVLDYMIDNVNLDLSSQFWPKTFTKLLDIVIKNRSDLNYELEIWQALLESFYINTKNPNDLLKIYKNFKSKLNDNQIIYLFEHENAPKELVEDLYTNYIDLIIDYYEDSTRFYYITKIPKNIFLDILRRVAKRTGLDYSTQKYLSEYDDEIVQLNIAKNEDINHKFLIYLSEKSPFESVRKEILFRE